MNRPPVARALFSTLALLAVHVLQSPSPLAAQLPLPLGLDQLVNTTLLGEQDEVSVAIGAQNDLVVAWRDSILDGVLSAIAARRFDAETGLPLTSQIQINIEIIGDQRNPAVAIGADGRFLVAWEGPDTLLPATAGIYGSLRDANGDPIEGEFAINTTLSGHQRRPAVAMQPDGAFLVAWQDESTTPTTIMARLYPATFPDDPPGSPFPLPTVATGTKQRPALAPDLSTGGWFAAWQAPFGGPAVPSVLFRPLTASGSGPAEVPLNSSTTNVSRSRVALGANASGEAIAAWQAPDGDGEGIFGRSVEAGVPVEAEFAINLETATDQIEPSIALDAQGSWVAVWISGDSNDRPDEFAPLGSPIVIKGRKKAPNATLQRGATVLASDDEFQVNATGAAFTEPWVATAPNGNFAATWSATEGEDEDGSGVYLRRFAVAVFVDGFESGDTAEWNASPRPRIRSRR